MDRRPSPTLEAATTAARIVYPETSLGVRGELIYAQWQEAAQAHEDPLSLWDEDWPAVLRGFRSTEGALKALNAVRAEDEDPPLTTEEELQELFSESEEWELAFLGEYEGFPIHVWAYGPWDGQLAFALAISEETTSAVATNIS